MEFENYSVSQLPTLRALIEKHHPAEKIAKSVLVYREMFGRSLILKGFTKQGSASLTVRNNGMLGLYSSINLKLIS
jgi:hypothetical protein